MCNMLEQWSHPDGIIVHRHRAYCISRNGKNDSVIYRAYLRDARKILIAETEYKTYLRITGSGEMQERREWIGGRWMT